MPDAPPPDDTSLGTQSATLEVGQRVFRQYVLKRFLSRGPLGSAWLVAQEDSGRELAMRFVPESWLRNERVIARVREAVVRSIEIAHPGVVGVLDFMRDSQTGAIVSKFVEAQTALEAKSQRPERCFQVGALRPWLTQVCEALDFAWRQCQAVHGDLCPANLLITTLGEMKLADFGLARCLVDLESPTGGPLIPTVLAFASPERARGAAVTVADDVYAFGATLYDLLTSKPPFFQDDVRSQLENVVAPSMAERRAELGLVGDPIAPEWEEVIAACLAKRPEDRPKSVREIGERLGLLAPLPATAPASPEVAAPAVVLPPRFEPAPATVDGSLDLEMTVVDADLEATMIGKPAPSQASPDDSHATIAAEEPLRPAAPATVVPPDPPRPKRVDDSVTMPTPPPRPAPEPKPTPLPPPSAPVPVTPVTPVARGGLGGWWFAVAALLVVLGALPFVLRKSPAPVAPLPIPTTPVAETPKPEATPLPVVATPVPATPAPTFRTVQAGDLGELADKGPAREPLLLTGNFRVSSATANHAIMRPAEPTLTGKIRIMATLRPAASLPAEGATIELTDTSRYFVREVRRSADGQFNVEVEQR